MKYIYLLSGGQNERDLAVAEAVALSGGRRCADKLIESDTLVDIPRTAYIAAGIQLLAHGQTVDDACRQLAALHIASDRFGLEVIRVPRHLPVGRRESANAFALAIEGRPDLDHPAERFTALLTPEGVWFGRTLESAPPDWLRFKHKPFDFSSALPAQNARALCNLLIRVARPSWPCPENPRVIDPCCGSGTLLLHAAALGAHITGHDINPKMVGATNKNLEHFGSPPAASLADAAEIRGAYDFVLTNIPYGNMSAVTAAAARRIIANLVRLAPRGLIVAAHDITPDLTASGATVRQLIQLPKFSVLRLIFLYERTTPLP